jgi:hypothetical protein
MDKEGQKGMDTLGKLTANFRVSLPAYLLVNRPREDMLRFNTRIEGFDVGLELIPGGGWKGKEAGEQHFSFGISAVLISVARVEEEKPPSVQPTPDGTRDYTVQSKYFRERLPAYQEVAVKALNRVILYFKYKLHNPLLHEFRVRDQWFQNPKWTDESGREAGKGPGITMVTAIPGLSPWRFGAKKLTRSKDSELQRAFDEPIIPELHEELLSDAQSAVFQGNLRRAILEMAIACEVSVKQAFFSKSTAAGGAFEYLEDRGRINVRIPELIDGAALQAFGESFKEVSEIDYRNIDFLFRCRNKIAHRGEIRYRDDAGNTHDVDLSLLESWWESVERLTSWLNSHRS